MIKEFPIRQWKRSTLNDLIKRIDENGSDDRKMDTGRPRSVRTSDNIAIVNKLICSQEGQPGLSKTSREILRETGICGVHCLPSLSHSRIEHLKEVLQTCWEQIGQDVIDRAIGQFRKRLSLVVATGGDTLSTALTKVFFGATRTLSHLRV